VQVHVQTATGPGGLSGPLRVDFSSNPLRGYSASEARSAFSRTLDNHKRVGWGGPGQQQQAAGNAPQQPAAGPSGLSAGAAAGPAAAGPTGADATLRRVIALARAGAPAVAQHAPMPAGPPAAPAPPAAAAAPAAGAAGLVSSWRSLTQHTARGGGMPAAAAAVPRKQTAHVIYILSDSDEDSAGSGKPRRSSRLASSPAVHMPRPRARRQSRGNAPAAAAPAAAAAAAPAAPAAAQAPEAAPPPAPAKAALRHPLDGIFRRPLKRKSSIDAIMISDSDEDEVVQPLLRPRKRQQQANADAAARALAAMACQGRQAVRVTAATTAAGTATAGAAAGGAAAAGTGAAPAPPGKVQLEVHFPEHWDFSKPMKRSSKRWSAG
jgi:hypothetical protein